jgi:hypothetical protein
MDIRLKALTHQPFGIKKEKSDRELYYKKRGDIPFNFATKDTPPTYIHFKRTKITNYTNATENERH